MPEGLRRASEWSWRLLLVGALIFAVGWVLAQVFLVVVVVIVALLITSLLEPPTARLCRRGWNRALATTVTLGAALLIVAAFTALLVPQVADEFAKVGDQASEGVREAQDWLINGPLHLSDKQVDKIANGMVRQLQGGGGSSLVSGVVSGAAAAGSVIAAILLIAALTALFLRDGRTLWEWLVGLLPASSRRRTREIGAVSWETLSAYIRGIVIIGLFDAVFIGLGMLVLGVPLVLPLMALTFVGAFVPVAGSTIAGLVAALVALVDQGAVTAGILIAVIIFVQQFEGIVLYPVIMRRAVDTHPVAVLLAVAAGAVLMGIFGAVIAVPIVAIAGRVIALVRADQEDAERRFISAQDTPEMLSSLSTSARSFQPPTDART